MYKIVICIISLLPFVASGESLPVKPLVQPKIEIQNQQANNEEDFFPDIPLSLDSNILKKRNELDTTNTESQIRLPNVKPQTEDDIKDDVLPEEEPLSSNNNITLERFIDPASRQEETEYNFWKVRDTKKHINKKYVVLPEAISRRKYNPANDSLPTMIYLSDYQKAVFQEIKHNNLEAVKALLDLIKNKEFRNGEGDTPLLYAVRIGKINTIAWLLADGANIKAVDINNQDIYHIARKKERLDILELLHKYDI